MEEREEEDNPLRLVSLNNEYTSIALHSLKVLIAHWLGSHLSSLSPTHQLGLQQGTVLPLPLQTWLFSYLSHHFLLSSFLDVFLGPALTCIHPPSLSPGPLPTSTLTKLFLGTCDNLHTLVLKHNHLLS